MIAVLLVACGGRSAPTSTPTPPLPTALDLQSALLALSDLPAGWVSLSSTPSQSLNLSPCDAPAPDTQYEATSAAFQQGDHGARLTETLAAFHPGQAAAWLNSARQEPVCRQFAEPGPQGTPVTTQVSTTSPPALGDQAVGERLTTTFGGSTYVTEVVAVRSGDFIVQIAESRVAPVDSAALTALARQALAKLQATRP